MFWAALNIIPRPFTKSPGGAKNSAMHLLGWTYYFTFIFTCWLPHLFLQRIINFQICAVLTMQRVLSLLDVLTVTWSSSDHHRWSWVIWGYWSTDKSGHCRWPCCLTMEENSHCTGLFRYTSFVICRNFHCFGSVVLFLSNNWPGGLSHLCAPCYRKLLSWWRHIIDTLDFFNLQITAYWLHEITTLS